MLQEQFVDTMEKELRIEVDTGMTHRDFLLWLVAINQGYKGKKNKKLIRTFIQEQEDFSLDEYLKFEIKTKNHGVLEYSFDKEFPTDYHTRNQVQLFVDRVMRKYGIEYISISYDIVRPEK